ncbi:uncharacterized protein B0I36DRAFT_354995 [Microdochium trichocladiopsis]|uniref:Uncharacterized protein n=1 Tax=Microdochium trichocladiopsis TaxID=1682393 RepID=A0A9P8XUG5_9PEZI|nr:uncharacterized protein B0I36DRAFT_354995 [Microdochium trichocladiopsis]KAH7016139.1 hypothetical protein B0I36DRAFT_354995 [Microdochium trichocladiopsis]
MRRCSDEKMVGENLLLAFALSKIFEVVQNMCDFTLHCFYLLRCNSSRRVGNERQPIESPVNRDVGQVTNDAASDLATDTTAGQPLLRSATDGSRVLPGYDPGGFAPVALSSINAPETSINSSRDCQNDTAIGEYAQKYSTPPTVPHEVQTDRGHHVQSLGDECHVGGREHENTGANHIANGTSNTVADRTNGDADVEVGIEDRAASTALGKTTAPSSLVNGELATTMDVDNNHAAGLGLLLESCWDSSRQDDPRGDSHEATGDGRGSPCD